MPASASGLRTPFHTSTNGLMRGLSGAGVEIGLATMAYNLKRVTNLLGATELTEALHKA